MVNRSRQAALLSALSATALFTFATAAFAQITDSQRAAIRSECRSDYQAHCAGVPPGGMESLQCLQKNLSSLAPGCQSAVRAVAPPAETKTEAKPETKTETTPAPSAKPAPAAAPAAATNATASPAPAPAAAPSATTNTPAKKPSSAQVAAIRSACRSDYSKVCAGVPTGGATALQCLQKNKSRVSAGCQQAIAAAGSTATAAGPAPAAAAAPALTLRPMQPREQLFVLRSACGADVRTLCGGVAPGGGRMMQCLVAQSASLSPECRDILARFVAR